MKTKSNQPPLQKRFVKSVVIKKNPEKTEKNEDEVAIEIEKDEKIYDDFQTRKLIPPEMNNFAYTRIIKNTLFDYLNSFTDPILFRNFLDKRQ